MVDAIVLRSGYWYRNIQMPFDDKIHMQERSRPNPLPQNFSNGSAQYDWVIEIGVISLLSANCWSCSRVNYSLHYPGMPRSSK